MDNRVDSVEQIFPGLKKAPTGILGLDEILNGGLPEGRTTLISGGPGCGKTLLAMEFLVNGALIHDEPGVFMAFEETAQELSDNVASLHIDLPKLIEDKKIIVDYVYIERNEIEETGAYDLEGLFIRLNSAIDAIGAKRVVLDTIETIFAGFGSESILRSEIRRLFRWMKTKGVTAIVTGERGENMLTRYGLEEYVSDCVIVLDARVQSKITSRIMRVVKYRGSSHSIDEFPFLIGENGIWVSPVTSLRLNHHVTIDRISTGIPKLDEMLEGKGYFRGSMVLISGTAGTGKTSMAAMMVNAACQRGERCIYFAFEESANQIIRNVASIGVDLKQWVDKGLLQFHATRPTYYGIEMHLLMMDQAVREFNPSVVIVDPLTNLTSTGSDDEVKVMLVRLIDFLKTEQVTALFTSLTSGSNNETITDVGVSSLMDTWILVRNIENNGERNRGLYVLKSRGMAHSSQIREFRLSNTGIDLVDVYVGPEGVLTGSARVAQQTRKKVDELQQHQAIERKRKELERRRRQMESQIANLRAEFAEEEAAVNQQFAQDEISSSFEIEETNRNTQERQTGVVEKTQTLRKDKKDG